MKMKISPQVATKKKKKEIKIEQFKRLIFHNFQKHDQYCDITVKSADGATNIKAHRVILEAKMNNFKASAANSPIFQTTMDGVVLRNIVDYCYTDEVCFESVSQTLDLLKFAVAYGITDLTEKIRLYLNSSMTVKTEPCPEPQTPETPPSLVIFGSLDEDGCFGGAMLDPIDGKWKELAPMIGSQKNARRLTSVAYRGNDCVIVSGGMDKVKSKQNVHLVDLKAKKIETLPPMKTGRCEHASVVCNNFLYVAGGMRSGKHLDSVEKLDLKKRRWTTVSSLISERTLFPMVVANGLIYAIGGENKLQCLSTVECYDPVTKLWQNTTPMIRPRASAGVAVLNNAIYAVGGSTMFKFGDTETVERFNLDTKEWNLIASMNYSRYNVSCCVYQNVLIAAGGYDFASHSIDYVEVYDEKADRWIRSKAMSKARGRCQMFATSSRFDTT